MYRDDLAALQAALEEGNRRHREERDAILLQLAEQTALREQAELAASFLTGNTDRRRLQLLLVTCAVVALAGLAISGLLVFQLEDSQQELRGLTSTLEGMRQERTKRKAELINCQVALSSIHIPRRLELRCDEPPWAKPLYPLLDPFYSCLGDPRTSDQTQPIHFAISFTQQIGEMNQVLLKNGPYRPEQYVCLLEAAERLEPPAKAKGTTLAFSIYPQDPSE